MGIVNKAFCDKCGKEITGKIFTVNAFAVLYENERFFARDQDVTFANKLIYCEDCVEDTRRFFQWEP